MTTGREGMMELLLEKSTSVTPGSRIQKQQIVKHRRMALPNRQQSRRARYIRLINLPRHDRPKYLKSLPNDVYIGIM